MKLGHKYVSDTSDYSYDALEQNYIYATPFHDLNDVHEAMYVDEVVPGVNKIANWFGVDSSNVVQAWDKLKSRDRLGVFSYTTTRTNIPTNNTLWTHYANESRGYCIVYDVDMLESIVHPSFVNHVNVRYQEKPPTVSVTDLNKLKRGDYKQFVQKMYATKSKDHSQEKEGRLIYDMVGQVPYDRNPIKQVYFGAHCSEETKSKVMSKLKKNRIDYYQMRVKQGSYKLEPVVVKMSNPNDYFLHEFKYQIISEEKSHAVENYHIWYKDEDRSIERLNKFVKCFKEEYATNDSVNLFLFSINMPKPLIKTFYSEDEKEMIEDYFLGAVILGLDEVITDPMLL